MAAKVFVYDPTIKDRLSKTRGVGRYLKILRENFFKEFKFVDELRLVNNDAILINPFFNFLKPPLILKKIAGKQIAVVHDVIPLKYPKHFPAGIGGNINIFLNKKALKNYDLIITDSQASKKDIIAILGIKQEKIKVIYPCLQGSFYQNNLKTQTSGFKKEKLDIFDFNFEFCLYVGDATWNKNLVNLAKALKTININCVFVGKVFEKSAIDFKDGKLKMENKWQKELIDFFNQVKGDKRFIFPGFLADNHLIKLYQQALVNILLSRDEGFGFSYLEASYNKCPSVLSDISVFKEISAGQALFAESDNPSDIAKKISILCSNIKLREELGLKAWQRAKFFNQENFKKEFLRAVFCGNSQ